MSSLLTCRNSLSILDTSSLFKHHLSLLREKAFCCLITLLQPAVCCLSVLFQFFLT
jgi:hypothetical protein